MWCALAPDRISGRRLLLGLFLAVVEISEATEEPGRPAAPGANIVVPQKPSADRRHAMNAIAILPIVWATGQPGIPTHRMGIAEEPIPFQMAFYRKYTEGILQRYVRLSMESGKVPSLLGQEMFRGKVTSYRVGSFVDSVIFVHDVRKCIAKLDEEQQQLISRIALQQYTVCETAALMGLKPRTVVRRYGQAIDRLTRVFLGVHMLEPQECCQGGDGAN
jgi:Sigma-70, region 4